MLDAPERRYASDARQSRGGRGGLGVPGPERGPQDRRLRRDLSEDFASSPYSPYDEDDGPGTRRRGGLRVRFGGLPRDRRGWIVTAVLLLLSLAACAGAALLARDFVLHDERFVIPASSFLEFEGNQHVTRAQLLSVFGGDVGRNIFKVSLAERRTDLEQMPWVAHATVMRLLPNRLRVSIVERTPVAFVREGNHVGLVDANGVLLSLPVGMPAKGHYSFPVVTGITARDPLSIRAARMKIFSRFTSDLDSSGEPVSQKLNEVDLSNPEDVKALIPDHAADILVHFGEDDFLDRYRRFEAHLSEWRTVYPRLSSVDMRYERQVVLEMQPGSGVPMTSSTNAGGANPSADAFDAAAGSAAAAHASPRGKGTPSATVRVHPAEPDHSAKTASVVKPGRAAAQSADGSAAAPRRVAAKAKPHAAPAKRHPAVAAPSQGTTLYHPPQVIPPRGMHR